MTDFTHMIARHHGVSLRTVRRWCEQGKLPGAYRTRGGHWRLIGPYLKQLRRADKTATPEILRINRASPKQRIRWLKELVDVMRASFVLNGGSPALRPGCDDLPIRERLHPRAIEAVEHPRSRSHLMIHREELLIRGIKVTRRNLAASLEISPQTFRERYKEEDIISACSLAKDHAPGTVLTRTDKKRSTLNIGQRAPVWLARHPRKMRRVA
jgi:hypothetical protein